MAKVRKYLPAFITGVLMVYNGYSTENTKEN
jgi:hypothetical protein